MRYQLVLQFTGDDPRVLEELIALEDQLIAAFDGSADVDGHDIGSNQANVFVLTDEPIETFARAKPLLEKRGLLGSVRAAYRDADGDDYALLWPKNSTARFQIL